RRSSAPQRDRDRVRHPALRACARREAPRAHVGLVRYADRGRRVRHRRRALRRRLARARLLARGPFRPPPRLRRILTPAPICVAILRCSVAPLLGVASATPPLLASLAPRLARLSS